jgi:Tat protein translocase TatB subunit
VFGIGGSEIIVILVVALLFLGPDKLPDAAKTISKGIRDLKKQQRALQQQIENDDQIGGAIRDLKSALRGDPEPPKRPPVRKEPPKEDTEAAVETPTIMPPGHDAEGNLIAGDPNDANAGHDPDDPGVPDRMKVTLPLSAGEANVDVAAGKSEGDDDLAKLIKPASGSIAKSKTDG